MNIPSTTIAPFYVHGIPKIISEDYTLHIVIKTLELIETMGFASNPEYVEDLLLDAGATHIKIYDTDRGVRILMRIHDRPYGYDVFT